MKKPFCERHPDVEPIAVYHCPACRGESGGRKAAEHMTKAQRQRRAHKAAKARWKKAQRSAGEEQR